MRIEDPLVTTALPLPDTTKADVTIQATLKNLDTKPVSGKLRASFGSATVETRVAMGMLALDNIDAVLAGKPAPTLITQ